MSLSKKLMKAGSIKNASVLKNSKFFHEDDISPTDVYSLNIALGGNPQTAGIMPGLGIIAGPSRHFKSNLMLACAKAYKEAHPDTTILFYDNEFGTKEGYFASCGIDEEDVIHLPFTDIEQLKFDIVKKLEVIEPEDNVLIMVDSIGNAASKKEIDDAKDEKSVADMTRAKQLKSLFRIVTPHLKTKSIPMICINHTYADLTSPKQIMGGGTGPMYSADWVFIVGRRQVKDGKELIGYDFIINIEKSRYIKEKSALTYSATFDNGVDPYGGLLDIALITGHVEKPKVGWFTRPSVEDDKNWRRKATSSAEFWEPILKETDFPKACEDLYCLGGTARVIGVDDMFALGENVDLDTGEVVEE